MDNYREGKPPVTTQQNHFLEATAMSAGVILIKSFVADYNIDHNRPPSGWIIDLKAILFD